MSNDSIRNNVHETAQIPVEDIAPGTLVYIDTMSSGLVPARYTNVEHSTERRYVFVTVTANRRAYKRGEKLAYPADRIILRSHVHRRRGFSWITNMPYRFLPVQEA